MSVVVKVLFGKVVNSESVRVLSEENNEFKIRLGTILLALYGFFSMFGYFISHGLGADSTRQLYSQFENNATISVYLKWVLSTEIDLFRGLIFGLIAGIVIAVLILIIVTYQLSRLERQLQKELLNTRPAIIAGILVLVSYFVVFVFVSLFIECMRAHMVFRSSVDFLVILSVAAISFASTEIYVDSYRIHEERRDFIKDKTVQLKKLELEFAWGREVFHLATWVFVTIIIGGIALALLRWFYETPLEVRASSEFGVIMLCSILSISNIAVGFFVGVIYQIMRNMDDIIFVIKDRWKARVKRKKPTDA